MRPMGKKRKLDAAASASFEIEEVHQIPNASRQSGYAPQVYPHYQHAQNPMVPPPSYWFAQPPMFHPGASSSGIQGRPNEYPMPGQYYPSPYYPPPYVQDPKASSSRPSMHGQYYPPPVSSPPAVQPSQPPSPELDDVAVQVYQRLLSEDRGFYVSQIVNGVIAEVGPNKLGWSTMLQKVPCLKTLSSVEEKVNAFIVTYVAGRRVATLHDLLTELCLQEGIDGFEQLGLGSPLRYPLVVKYFTTYNVDEVCAITALDVLQDFMKFDTERDNKRLNMSRLLEYIADKRGLPSADHTCVRILNFGSLIGMLRKAKNEEREIMSEWQRLTTKKTKDMVSEFLSNAQVRNRPSHIRFQDEGDDEDEDSRPLETYSSCPYPSAHEERSKWFHPRGGFQLSTSDLGSFIAEWKEIAQTCSVTEVIPKMIAQSGLTTKQKRKFLAALGTFPGAHLLNLAVFALKNDSLQVLLLEGEMDSPRRGEASEDGEVSGMADYETMNSKIVEHFNGYTPEKSDKGKEWCNFVKWAGLCEKQLLQEISSDFGCKSLLEYMVQHLNSIELKGSMFLESRARNPSVPRNRVAAFLQQALPSKGDIDEIETENVVQRCCKQFQVRNREDLGLDDAESISRVRQEHSGAGFVYYTEALAGVQDQAQVEGFEGSDRVGRLGSVSSVDAVKCLTKAPILSELHEWSQWGSVFEPQLGRLVDWMEENGAGSGISVLVTCAGAVLRIDGEPRPDKFLGFITEGRPLETVGQMVSLAVLHGGAANAPKELLKSHSSKGLEILGAVAVENIRVGSKRKAAVAAAAFEGGGDVANFVMDCLVLAPKAFRLFVAEVLYPGFSAMVLNASNVLLHACRSSEHHMVLHSIGLELGILEWINDYKFRDVEAVVDVPSEEPPLKKQRCDHPGETSVMDVEVVTMVEDGAFVPENAEHVQPDVQTEVVEVKPEIKLDVVQFEAPAGLPSEMQLFVPQVDVSEDEEAVKVIEAIRRDEFGLEPGSSTTENDLLSKQHARIGRALQCLSHNLYSEDCHFILELVQNADDNSYPPDVSPALAFIIREDRIIILNNEEGFAAKNIRALCDVGNSTKSGSCAGYIGHKGIGFKSVFRITDSPEIHSNGYHVNFDISKSTLGFILPTPVSLPLGDADVKLLFAEDESTSDLSKSKTRIDLPLRPSIIEAAGTKSVSSMFFDLHPNLLLFLHKLRTLVVRDEILKTSRIFHRLDIGHGLVKVTDCGLEETYFVVQHRLPAAVVRPGVSSTELACAFGLKPSSDGTYEPRPVQQQVFAFLPVRSYGLKFIVQGDFILPSSREEVDRDSAWNQWLLSEIPKLFIQSASEFKTFTGFRSRGHAVTSYMSFVPLDGEVLGFFSSVPRMILSQLRGAPCLPTSDSLTWALPCMTLRGWDDGVRGLISDELLREHLGMVFLDREVVLSSSLAASLGVPEYGTGILASLMKSVCTKPGALEKLGAGWVRGWLLGLHGCILSDKQQKGEDWEILRSLRSSPFIPLASGEFTSLDDGPVWFLNSGSTDGAESEHFQKSFLSLYSELRTVSPMFLAEGSESGSGEAGIVKHMLKQLGVKVVLAHEIIKDHVLPMMTREDCVGKNGTLVVQYLAYCMLHLQLHKCESCETERVAIMSDLKRNAVVLTDVGLRRVRDDRVHFSAAMKNVVDMKSVVGGAEIEWRELADDYLRSIPSNLAVVSTKLWRKFFSELGVTDFVHVSPATVRLSASDRPGSIWSDEIPDDGHSSDWIVDDWQCGELSDIFEVLSSGRPEQCGLLLSAFDKMWDEGYEQFSKARFRVSTSSVTAGECTSSFVVGLRKFAWVKCSSNGKLMKPDQFFHRCDTVVNLLGECGPYADPQVKSAGLVKALGLRTEVNLEDVLNLFGQDKSTASFDQMERVYKFLEENMSAKKLRRFFKNNSCIFVPTAAVEKRQNVVPGKFYGRAEVTWTDPYNILANLEGADVSMKTLQAHYPALQSFFVNQCGVPEAPGFDDYLVILKELASRYTPSDVSKEVLGLFTAWSQEIQKDEIDSEEISRRRQLVLEKKARIFPTRKDTWVGLRNKNLLLCWNDDDALLKEFEDVSDAILFVEFKKKKKQTKKIKAFLQAFGISKFSEVVEREVIMYQVQEEYRELQDMVKWITPFAQGYMQQYHEETYGNFLSSSQHEHLMNLQCLIANQLYYRHLIRHKMVITSRRRIKCSCLLQDNKLHVALSHSKDYAAIFTELSRVFFAGETNNHLANFLHLTLLQSQKPPVLGFDSKMSNSQDVHPPPEGPTPSATTHDTTVAEGYLERNRHNQETLTNGNHANQELDEPRSVFQERDMMQTGGAPNEELREMTGRRGELLVYEHLCRKYGAERVKWLNQSVESGAAYDIVVEGAEDGDRSEFVEVKSTRSANKDWFELTPNEWDFAKQASNRYTIIRATLRENQKVAHLMTLRDPVRLCQEKSLKLAIILPKQPQQQHQRR